MNIRLFCLCIVVFISSCGIENKPASIHNPLQTLLEGNNRFAAGKSAHPNESLNDMAELKKGQHPLAVVVSCSDSRVPPELIFDQGLGAIFSVRTAGNVIGDYELGSIEYAVEHLKCNLIIVLGHENCGAVDAFVHNTEHKQNGHVQTIVDYIANEEEEKNIPSNLKTDMEATVKANILHGVHVLKNSAFNSEHSQQSVTVQIIGAFYDLDNGRIKLLQDKG